MNFLSRKPQPPTVAEHTEACHCGSSITTTSDARIDAWQAVHYNHPHKPYQPTGFASEGTTSIVERSWVEEAQHGITLRSK